jgi:hypothetical protein
MVIQQQLSVITESTTQSLPETTAQNQHHTNIDYDIELTDDGNIKTIPLFWVGNMVTFNNIYGITSRTDLLVEDTGKPKETHCQKVTNVSDKPNSIKLYRF